MYACKHINQKALRMIQCAEAYNRISSQTPTPICWEAKQLNPAVLELELME